MHRERARVKHNFHRGGSTRGRKLVFSLFRESDRDDSISYRDWWAEVEAALAKGYEPERVKIAMFEAMEGMAKDHAANIDQYGVLTALEILEGMDRLYGVSMTFQSLNAASVGYNNKPQKHVKITMIAPLRSPCFCGRDIQTAFTQAS